MASLQANAAQRASTCCWLGPKQVRVPAHACMLLGPSPTNFLPPGVFWFSLLRLTMAHGGSGAQVWLAQSTHTLHDPMVAHQSQWDRMVQRVMRRDLCWSARSDMRWTVIEWPQVDLELNSCWKSYRTSFWMPFRPLDSWWNTFCTRGYKNMDKGPRTWCKDLEGGERSSRNL